MEDTRKNQDRKIMRDRISEIRKKLLSQKYLDVLYLLDKPLFIDEQNSDEKEV